MQLRICTIFSLNFVFCQVPSYMPPSSHLGNKLLLLQIAQQTFGQAVLLIYVYIQRLLLVHTAFVRFEHHILPFLVLFYA